MVRNLRFLFGLILISMLVVTTWASLDKNVMEGVKDVLREPWAAATLADAYFGFITFYVWVFYKEATWAARLVWLLAILLLGNIAMSVYVLWALRKLGPGSRVEDLLLRKAMS